MEIYLIVLIAFAAVGLLAYLMVQWVSEYVASYKKTYIQQNLSMLNQLYVYLPPERLYTFKIIGAVGLGLLTLIYVRDLPHPFPQVLFPLGALVGLYIPDAVLRIMLIQRRKRFNKQMSDVMNSITNGLRSGFSFLQALQMVGERMPEPAGQEFRMTMHEVKLGVGIAEALAAMDKRLNDEDLRTMIVATRLTMQTGGDLPTVYHQLTEMIRDRNRVEGKIKALTAQGKMQALIVSLMPPAMFFIVRSVNPTLIEGMLKTVEGWLIIGAVLVLDIIGYFWIRKLITIKF